jgi:hypothetical protein
MNTATESEKNASAPDAPQPKAKRAAAKKAKGATLAEIMVVTKWQAHTVRGFVSILGSKVGEEIESSKRSRPAESLRTGIRKPRRSRMI